VIDLVNDEEVSAHGGVDVIVSGQTPDWKYWWREEKAGVKVSLASSSQ